MTRRLAHQLPVTLTPAQFRSGVPCDLHELPWCATCSGKDRPSLDGIPDGTAFVEVWPPSVCLADSGGRCPSCGRGFAKGWKIGYSLDLDAWVPLYCCGQPTRDDDDDRGHLFRDFRHARWMGQTYPNHYQPGQLPDTMTDDHLEDPAP
jgi:hypothetical protein